MLVTRKCHRCGNRNRFEKSQLRGELRCQKCDGRIRRTIRHSSRIATLSKGSLNSATEIAKLCYASISEEATQLLKRIRQFVFGDEVIGGKIQDTRERTGDVATKTRGLLGYYRHALGLLLVMFCLGWVAIRYWPKSVSQPEASASSLPPAESEARIEAALPAESTVLNSPPPEWKPKVFSSKPVWTAGQARRFEVADAETVAWSACPSRYVTIDGNIYSVASGEVVGTTGGIAEPLDVNSEGSLLLGYDERRSVAIVEAGRTNEIVEIPTRGDVGVVCFAGNNLILIHALEPVPKAYVYDCSGNLIREFETSAFRSNTSAVSADGKFLAIATTLSVDVYSLETGTRVQLMEPVNSVFPPTASVGLSFSPDGSQLAQLMHKNRLVVWDVHDGSLKLNHTLSAQLTSLNSSVESHGIQWIPDGRGWLLAGSMLVTSDPVIEVWDGALAAPLTVIDSQHLSTVIDGSVIPIALPWTEIEQIQVVPVLTAGAAVTIVLTADRQTDELKALVRRTVRDRLVAGGFRVSPNAPLVLSIDYREEVGTRKGWAEKYENEYRDEFGRAVQSTDVLCDLRLRLGGTNVVVWSQSFRTDGGLPGATTTTADRLRRRAIDDTLTELSHVAIPSRLLHDPSGRFPLRYDPKPPSDSIAVGGLKPSGE